MEFPLKMRVLSLDKIPSDPHPCVECVYEIVDAKGEVAVPRNHFVCKAREFDEVAKYTLERHGARFAQAQTSDVEASSALVRATLASLRGEQAAPAAPAPPTLLDQTISPPGPTRKVAVK